MSSFTVLINILWYLSNHGNFLKLPKKVDTLEYLHGLIHVISEQYSLREARLHLKRVRSLIQPDIQVNAQNGVDNLSLTFAGVVAGRDVEGTAASNKRIKLECQLLILEEMIYIGW